MTISSFEFGLSSVFTRNFDKSELFLEIQNIMAERNVCTMCGKVCSRPDHLKNHMKYCNNTAPELMHYICEICYTPCLYKRNWSKHLKRAHGKTVEEVLEIKRRGILQRLMPNKNSKQVNFHNYLNVFYSKKNTFL